MFSCCNIVYRNKSTYQSNDHSVIKHTDVSDLTIYICYSILVYRNGLCVNALVKGSPPVASP